MDRDFKQQLEALPLGMVSKPVQVLTKPKLQFNAWNKAMLEKTLYIQPYPMSEILTKLKLQYRFSLAAAFGAVRRVKQLILKSRLRRKWSNYV